MSLNAQQISALLQPYIAPAPEFAVSDDSTAAQPSDLQRNLPQVPHSTQDWPQICQQLVAYLDLLLKWNARMNLTAIREPEEIVRRHFGESLFGGLYLQQLQSLECSTWNIPAVEAGDTHSQSDPHSSPAPDHAPDSLLDFGSGAGFPGLPIQILLPDLAVTLAEARQKKASFLREVVRTLGLKTEIWAGRVENLPSGRQFGVVTMRAVDEMQLAIPAAASRARNSLVILATQNLQLELPAFSKPALTPIPETSEGVLLHFRRVSAQ